MTRIEPITSSGPALWAAFLACSWTWCIGMFLPVILVREMGIWGWIVFAVPNVIGAAAMGWVLMDGDASRLFVKRHRSACVVFSLVTVLFHLFYTGWIIHFLLGWPLMIGTLLLAAGIWQIGHSRRRLDLWVAGAVLLLSLAAFVSGADMKPLLGNPGLATMSPLPAMWLAPVSIFGFMLCPYLDLTFHRARQSTTPTGGRVAFGVGFGVLFLIMILFSLWYAPWLDGLLSGAVAHGTLAVIVGLHMLIQTAFTVAVHLRELSPAQLAGRLRIAGTLTSLAGALLVAIAVLFLLAALGPSAGETIYLMFMSFYGLVFPGYVWLCAVPGRGWCVPGAMRHNLIVLLICVLVAGPMFWMGFMEMKFLWLIPGVLIMVLGRLFVRSTSQLPHA